MAKIFNEQRVLGVEVVGSDDAAYSDETGEADGSVVALLKGIYAQNAAIIALLTSIDDNTEA